MMQRVSRACQRQLSYLLNIRFYMVSVAHVLVSFDIDLGRGPKLAYLSQCPTWTFCFYLFIFMFILDVVVALHTCL